MLHLSRGNACMNDSGHFCMGNGFLVCIRVWTQHFTSACSSFVVLLCGTFNGGD